MTITQLQETKKGRFSVFADGEFLFSVHKDTFLLRPELAVGRQVTVETLEEIRLEFLEGQQLVHGLHTLTAYADLGIVGHLDHIAQKAMIVSTVLDPADKAAVDLGLIHLDAL